MSQAAIEGIRKSYGAAPVLHDLTLSFPDGQLTAIVGPSGCGKTTLLRCLNGLVRPEAGFVRLFGSPLDYERLPETRRRLGYAVQGVGLFPHLSCRENIELLGRLEGWDPPRRRERTERLLAAAGLDAAVADRHPHQLSGGQQQRVGLCRALFLNPPILLLDEPFGALDPITRSDLHDEFLRLQRAEPRTIILVTHDLREAVRLAQHLVILRSGRIVQEGEPEAVRRDPADAFVRSLFER